MSFISNGFCTAIEHECPPLYYPFRCSLAICCRLQWLPQLLNGEDSGTWLLSIATAYLTDQLQSLKETFAAKLPGEIEKIKKLRKYAPIPETSVSQH